MKSTDNLIIDEFYIIRKSRYARFPNHARAKRYILVLQLVYNDNYGGLQFRIIFCSQTSGYKPGDIILIKDSSNEFKKMEPLGDLHSVENNLENI
jgi:hypothetical protein